MINQSRFLKEALDKTLETQTQEVNKALSLFNSSLKSGGKILACGNGGSAAQCQHFVAELVVRFKKERRAIPAISLTTDTSNITACANDYSFDNIFERQVEALARPNDVLFCLSTSGSSKNIIKAAQKAKSLNVKVISLTGPKQNQLEEISDIIIKAQADSTDRIQEVHLFLIHNFCEQIENELTA